MANSKPFRQLILQHAVRTDVGQRRGENQDAYGVCQTPGSSLFIVADGMGGARGGATASIIAVNVIAREAFNEDGVVTEESLRSAINKANALVYAFGNRDEELSGMGTTVVSVAITGDKLHLAFVGDSRIYHYAEGLILQLSRDHTLVQELVDTGALESEEASNHPIAHMLTRSLGPLASIDVESKTLIGQMEVGDKILLCCDGLYNHVESNEIGDVLADHSPEESVVRLVDMANARGGTDNITVEVLEIIKKIGDPTSDIAENEVEFELECSGTAEDIGLDIDFDDLDRVFMRLAREAREMMEEGKVSEALEEVSAMAPASLDSEVDNDPPLMRKERKQVEDTSTPKESSDSDREIAEEISERVVLGGNLTELDIMSAGLEASGLEEERLKGGFQEKLEEEKLTEEESEEAFTSEDVEDIESQDTEQDIEEGDSEDSEESEEESDASDFKSPESEADVPNSEEIKEQIVISMPSTAFTLEGELEQIAIVEQSRETEHSETGAFDTDSQELKKLRLTAALVVGVVVILVCGSVVAYSPDLQQKLASILQNNKVATSVTTPAPTPSVMPTRTPVVMMPTATPSPKLTVIASSTPRPTEVPTLEPTLEPTPVPTLEPTPEPTPEPTLEPTPEPTPVPTPLIDLDPDPPVEPVSLVGSGQETKVAQPKNVGQFVSINNTSKVLLTKDEKVKVVKDKIRLRKEIRDIDQKLKVKTAKSKVDAKKEISKIKSELDSISITEKVIKQNIEKAKKMQAIWESRDTQLKGRTKEALSLAADMIDDAPEVAARKNALNKAKRAFLEAQTMFQEDTAMAAEMAAAGREYKRTRARVEEAVSRAIRGGIKKEKNNISKGRVKLGELSRRRSELNKHIGYMKTFSPHESDKRKKKAQEELLKQRKELKEKLDALNEIVSKEDEEIVVTHEKLLMD